MPPDLPEANRRRETQTELVYQNLVWQYYQFYLFSANALFALALLYAAWLARELSTTGLRPGLALPAALLVPVGYVLYASAKDSLERLQQAPDQRAPGGPRAKGGGRVSNGDDAKTSTNFRGTDSAPSPKPPQPQPRTPAPPPPKKG